MFDMETQQYDVRMVLFLVTQSPTQSEGVLILGPFTVSPTEFHLPPLHSTTLQVIHCLYSSLNYRTTYNTSYSEV